MLHQEISTLNSVIKNNGYPKTFINQLVPQNSFRQINPFDTSALAKIKNR